VSGSQESIRNGYSFPPGEDCQIRRLEQALTWQRKIKPAEGRACGMGEAFPEREFSTRASARQTMPFRFLRARTLTFTLAGLAG
jgi:hypothetical protein